MKRQITISLLAAILIALACSGQELELSGTLLDENKIPNSNISVILTRLPTPEEAERLIDALPFDTKRPESPEEFEQFMNDFSLDLDGNEMGWGCRSDGSGHFAFSNLTSGKYVLSVMDSPLGQKVKFEGFEYTTTHTDLSSGSISNLIITPIQIDYFTVQGKLISTKSGSPIVADVAFYESASEMGPSISLENSLELMKEVKSDKNGIFLKHHVPVGDYSVWLSNIDEICQVRSHVSFPIQISNNGDIMIADLYKEYLSKIGVDIRIWTTKNASETPK